MATIKEIQAALIRVNIGVGRAGADGIWGRDSIEGLRIFQKARGLQPTGVLNFATMQALFPQGATNPAPVWLEEARRLLGTKEIVGPKSNSVIMGWAQKLGLWYPSDETAWCGLFVAHCIGATLPGEAMPANPLGARNWAKFGHGIATPGLGAVLVFWRGSKTGWAGHVGFYVGETKTSYKVLGGNQGNSVSEAWLDKARLIDIRWPSTAMPPTGAVHLSTSGKLSTNEA